jgi:putative N-acetylmannosamine-6-phosphate epimerase
MPVQRLRNGLVVSCQPVPGGAMDRTDIVVAFAQAALAGGAAGLRIESPAHVAAVRSVTDAPIIGIVKRDLPDSPVRITPTLRDVAALRAAGADVIAVDATLRPRPVPAPALILAIRDLGAVAMADCAEPGDARVALDAGAELVATTLSGYVSGPVPEEPDLDLVAALRRMTPHVVAEGRIHRPDQAAEALRRGAWAVVVGSAITRPEHVTGWFRDAVAAAAAETPA